MKPTVLENAIRLALDAHAGQRDKQGLPYILHPLRVMLMGTTEDERVAGVLHDVFEDTTTPWSALVTLRCSTDVRVALDSLTRRAGKGGKRETYAAYIDRLALDPLAKVVKLNDIHDNLTRIADFPTLEARYRAAIQRLTTPPEIAEDIQQVLGPANEDGV